MFNNLLLALEVESKYHFLIIEIFVICITVLFISIFLVNFKFNPSTENVYYRRFCISILISVVLDFINYICESTSSINLIWLDYIVNALYISITMYLVVNWIIFILHKLNPDFLKKKKNLILMHIPVFTHVALSFISIPTGWLFYIDANGYYQRGPLFILQMTPWVYFLISTIYCIIKSLNNSSQGKINILILMYALFPLIAEIFQITTVGVPSLTIGYTIGAIYTYMIILEDNISFDGLTGLNNRQYFVKHLTTKLKNITLNDDLYLFIFDANKFKSINDKYGHVEGDNALKIISRVLLKVNNEYDGYLARFGGDEFVLLTSKVNKESCNEVGEKINKLLEEECINNKLPYKLVLAAGYTKCYPNDINDLNRLLVRADGELYVNKGILKNTKK